MLWQYNGPLKKDHSVNFVCIQYQPTKCALHNSGFGKISSDDNIANNKGQIISEQNCCVLNFLKNNEITLRIIALASKRGQIKKIKALYYTN